MLTLHPPTYISFGLLFLFLRTWTQKQVSHFPPQMPLLFHIPSSAKIVMFSAKLPVACVQGRSAVTASFSEHPINLVVAFMIPLTPTPTFCCLKALALFGRHIIWQSEKFFSTKFQTVYQVLPWERQRGFLESFHEHIIWFDFLSWNLVNHVTSRSLWNCVKYPHRMSSAAFIYTVCERETHREKVKQWNQ